MKYILTMKTFEGKKRYSFKEYQFQILDYVLFYNKDTNYLGLVKVENMSSSEISFEDIIPKKSDPSFNFITYDIKQEVLADVLGIFDNEEEAIKAYHQKMAENRFDL